MPFPHHSWVSRLLRNLVWVVLLAVLGAAAGGGAEAPPPALAERTTFRLGFTFSMFTDVNENDARASIRALSGVVAREHGIPADPDPLLLTDAEAVAKAVQTSQIDAVGMTTAEYWTIAREAPFDHFLLAVKNGDPTDEYVVLVRRDSGMTKLEDLRDKRLSVFANSRICLAPLWLEVLLGRQGLPAVADHFAVVTTLPKISRTVLDVFFQKSDACLVTQRGFAAMAELNPQVGKQLMALATSPVVVPTLFAFRSTFSVSLKEKVIREFSAVHRTPAGQQAMTIFQVGQVAEHPAAALDSAFALLDEYARLRPTASAALVATLRHKRGINLINGRP